MKGFHRQQATGDWVHLRLPWSSVVFIQKGSHTALMVSSKDVSLGITQVMAHPTDGAGGPRNDRWRANVQTTGSWDPWATSSRPLLHTQPGEDSAASGQFTTISILEPFGADVTASIELTQRELMAHETGTGKRETVKAQRVRATPRRARIRANALWGVLTPVSCRFRCGVSPHGGPVDDARGARAAARARVVHGCAHVLCAGDARACGGAYILQLPWLSQIW